MKRAQRFAFNELKKMGVPVFERSDYPDTFLISAEQSNSSDWAYYYSERPDWIFGVNPLIDKALRKRGLFAEWETPGALIVFEG